MTYEIIINGISVHKIECSTVMEALQDALSYKVNDSDYIQIKRIS